MAHPPSSPGEGRFFLQKVSFPSVEVIVMEMFCGVSARLLPLPARASPEFSWAPRREDPLGLLWVKPTHGGVPPPTSPAHPSCPRSASVICQN